MEFPKNIEQLENTFSEYCEMYYKLYSTFEYKDEVEIKISFIDLYNASIIKSIFECDIDFKSINDFDKSLDAYGEYVGEHVYDQILVLIEYYYNNKRTGIKIPIWANGLYNQGFNIDFYNFEFINKIFKKISHMVLVHEDWIFKSGIWTDA